MTPQEAKNTLEKFKDKDFYPSQLEAIEFILNSPAKIDIIEAPTGTGKSLIGAICCICQGEGTYLVHSKPLQWQLFYDFPSFKLLQGRNNYPCLLSPDVTAAECIESVKEHKFKERLKKGTLCPHLTTCPYKIEKEKVYKADFRILNYHYLLFEANYVGKFSNIDFLVIDEADSLEKVLMDFISIAFNVKVIRKLNLPLPEFKTTQAKLGLESWQDWMLFTQKKLFKLNKEYTSLADQIEKIVTPEDKKIIRYLNIIRSLIAKTKLFLNHVDDTWLFEHTDKQWSFKPTWIVPELAENYLWSHAEKIILMSASFKPLEILKKELGLDFTNVSYKQLPSLFKPENRKIIIKPVADMTYQKKKEEIPKMIREVREIIFDIHPDEKGLIHTVSYELANRIVREIKTDRFLFHDSRNKQDMLEKFMDSDKPLIFISPSSERGLSLDGEKARFQIICKAPYLNLKDKMVSKRLYSGWIGRFWYVMDMLMTVEQMSGRIVRNINDYGVTYILDQQIKDNILKNRRHMHEWWLDAIEFEYADDLKKEESKDELLVL